MAKIPKLRTITDPSEIQPRKKVPELIRVPGDKPLRGILCCNGPVHLPTHWTGSRTVICEGQGACEHCPHKGIKDYYLVALMDKITGVVSWVELTENAAQSLLCQLREFERSFYGALVQIGRERKTMSAPIVVAVDLNSQVSGRLPKPMDPTETLERVFNSTRSTGVPARKPV
jgi:hypothetical protein